MPAAKTPTRTHTPARLAEFEQAFDAFFASVRRARGRAAAETSTEGLTLAQYQLLAAFGDREEWPVGELAEAGGVAAPTATRMLAGLEREGVVERSHCKQDGRRVQVRLTAAGRRLLTAKRRNVVAKRRRMFESLSPAERRDAARLLGRLADVMDEL
jgi:DNA-binding MarR family transcriptional regulator